MKLVRLNIFGQSYVLTSRNCSKEIERIRIQSVLMKECKLPQLKCIGSPQPILNRLLTRLHYFLKWSSRFKILNIRHWKSLYFCRILTHFIPWLYNTKCCCCSDVYFNHLVSCIWKNYSVSWRYNPLALNFCP